jgi:hypothetical protein
MPPPPPFVPQGGYPDGGWLKPTADHMELATPGTVDQFSAACWFFGQSLTDGWVERGEPVVPLGMVTSNWGGTTVQQWTPVTALSQCTNATGGSTVFNRTDLANGALYSGMVAPFVNMTIKGAVWYQVRALISITFRRLIDPRRAMRRVRITCWSAPSRRRAAVAAQQPAAPRPTTAGMDVICSCSCRNGGSCGAQCPGQRQLTSRSASSASPRAHPRDTAATWLSSVTRRSGSARSSPARLSRTRSSRKRKSLRSLPSRVMSRTIV